MNVDMNQVLPLSATMIAKLCSRYGFVDLYIGLSVEVKSLGCLHISLR